MAQLEKCLLHRHENLSLDPSMHMRNCVLVCTYNPRAGKWSQENGRACWQAVSAYLVSSMTVRGSAPGNKGHGTGGSVPDFDLCLHSHAHTCIYTLARINSRYVQWSSGQKYTLVSCCVEFAVDFVLFTCSWERGKKKKTSVFLEKSLKRLLQDSFCKE